MIEFKPDEDFKKLKAYLLRLNIVVSELEALEDFRDVDYSEISTDIGYSVYQLESRRESLQRRGRRL